MTGTAQAKAIPVTELKKCPKWTLTIGNIASPQVAAPDVQVVLTHPSRQANGPAALATRPFNRVARGGVEPPTYRPWTAQDKV